MCRAGRNGTIPKFKGEPHTKRRGCSRRGYDEVPSCVTGTLSTQTLLLLGNTDTDSNSLR